MAHYAKIEDGVVTQVIVAHSKLWCEEPLHKNYAGIGYLWDGIGFYSPACHDEATLNPDTYLWDCTNADHEIKPLEITE